MWGIGAGALKTAYGLSLCNHVIKRGGGVYVALGMIFAYKEDAKSQM